MQNIIETNMIKKEKKNQNNQIMISKTSNSIKNRKTIKKIKTITTTILKKNIDNKKLQLYR